MSGSEAKGGGPPPSLFLLKAGRLLHPYLGSTAKAQRSASPRAPICLSSEQRSQGFLPAVFVMAPNSSNSSAFVLPVRFVGHVLERGFLGCVQAHGCMLRLDSEFRRAAGALLSIHAKTGARSRLLAIGAWRHFAFTEQVFACARIQPRVRA